MWPLQCLLAFTHTFWKFKTSPLSGPPFAILKLMWQKRILDFLPTPTPFKTYSSVVFCISVKRITCCLSQACRSYSRCLSSFHFPLTEHKHVLWTLITWLPLFNHSDFALNLRSSETFLSHSVYDNPSHLQPCHFI